MILWGDEKWTVDSGLPLYRATSFWVRLGQMTSAFIAMGPGLAVITRIGAITMNAEEIITRFLT